VNPYAESAYFVVKNPQYCFIDYAKTFALAQKFVSQDLKMPSWREPVYPESDENIIDFLGVINSVNFCFTDFNTHKKFDIEYPENSGKIWSGAFGMTMCFKRALEEGIPVLDPRFLINLTEKDAEYIFRHKNTAIPMFYERFFNLKNVGFMLYNSYLGFDSFTQIFKQNNFRFLDIVDQLSYGFSSYRDSSFLGDRRILFCKRAQLFPMMYHGRALSSGGGLQPIRDPENFGPVADYEVPKILRMFGAICYLPELAAKVDNGVVIPKDSSEEIEIRAMTVVAMAQLLDYINCERQEKNLKKITMAELDYAVWNMGRGPEYKALRHHYTYTTAY